MRRLLEHAYALRRTDPAQGLELCLRAVDLSHARAGSATRALAWAHLGNAFRVANRLPDAQGAMRQAEQHLDEECAPNVRAEILELQASLYQALRWFPLATAAIREAIALRLELGDDNGRARGILQLAAINGHSGACWTALRLIREALPLISDPDLLRVAVHNAAWFWLDAGDAETSQLLVLEIESQGWLSPEPLAVLRHRWLHARIAAALGEKEVSARELTEVRDAFLSRDLHYDAAFVALELALVWASSRRWADVESTLEGVMGIFLALRVPPAASATRLLAESARDLQAVEVLVPRIVAALRSEPMAANISGAP